MIKKKIISIFLSFLIMLLSIFSVLSLGTTYRDLASIIVDVNGNGDYTTIQEAVTNANSGDTIYVWDGAYTLTSDLTISKPLSIIGNGTSTVHLNCNDKVIYIAFGGNYVNISYLNMYNGKSSSYDGYIRTLNCNYVHFHHLLFNASDTPEYVSLTGIYMAEGHNITIDNCTFKDINDDFIDAFTYDIIIENCTFDNGIGSALHSIGTAYYSTIIRNCTFINITDTHIYVYSGENVTIYNNIFFNATTGIYMQGSNNTNYPLIYNNYFYNVTNFITLQNRWVPGVSFNISKTLGTNIVGGPYKGGNYYYNYTGTDSDYDGIGNTDIPFIGFDYLPLVNHTYIQFISIDGNGNGTNINTSTPTFNWTKVSNAIQYNLQISNDSLFTEPLLLNITNINIYEYPSYYSENTTRVSFVLPSTYSLPVYKIYYTRVRAYR